MTLEKTAKAGLLLMLLVFGLSAHGWAGKQVHLPSPFRSSLETS